MKLNEKMVDKLAKLSKLEFNEQEKSSILKDMNKMLAFIEKLNELDTDDVEPLIHMTNEVNILRDDVAENSISREEALKNAPAKDSTYFKIPKVLNK